MLLTDTNVLSNRVGFPQVKGHSPDDSLYFRTRDEGYQELWVSTGKHLLLFVATEVSAGPISNACMQSNRRAANAALCGCIQTVADNTLAGADPRRAAAFFRDPDKAQKVFLSQNRADDAFWARYKAFGAQAEQSCSG